MIRALLGLLLTLFWLTACAEPAPASPQISVANAWARPAVVGSMSATSERQGRAGMSGSGTTSAAYVVIVHQGSEADTLLDATSRRASKAAMHETHIVGDVAEIVPVPRVDVPAGGCIACKPGGYHVMLEGLTQDLTVGATSKLTLQFAKSGAIMLDVPIQAGNEA